MSTDTGMAETAGARPVIEVLAWGRAMVYPVLREAVATLPEAMRLMAGYHFGWWDADGAPAGDGPDRVAAGKAIRPALALLAAEAVGGEAADALPAAVAVELVHNFSLIQDDVIDGDLTRRHRPTVWSVFTPGAAIVAGDALLTLAFDALAARHHPAAREASRMLHTAVLALLEGQASDLSFERRNDVELAECVTMAEEKSGALLASACAVGARLGGGEPGQVARLHRFGVELGVAFQLADDLLGIWGDPVRTGKPIFADLQRRKKSLPLVAALTSGTTAADELAALYYRDRPLPDAALTRAAALVEQAGGRSWSQARAEDLLAAALAQLRAAVEPGRASDELAGVARLAVHRDH